VDFGGCQHENGVRRRLLKRFKQRVEGCRRKHVYFVDDIDFIAALGWLEIDLIAQVADVIDGGVGGCINFDQVKKPALIYRQAVRAMVAGAVLQVIGQAVDRFGK